MKIPVSWLKEFVSTDLSVDNIAKILTESGLEVDKIERIGSDFSNVVVVKVLNTIPHPNAEKLRIATVFDGKEELQIVCGASNCRAGIKTALARIGAELPGENGEKWTVKKAKLRSVESFGMLCSGKELGISEEDEGILELDEKIKEGTDVQTLFSDFVLEISLTPNLGHCLSVLGVARELAANLNTDINIPSPQPQEESSQLSTKISIEDNSCKNYRCRLLENVVVGPSPEWLKRRLELCGIRSINNVVDALNYTMVECGQPMHAFDFGTFSRNEVHVKKIKTETALKALDSNEYTLKEGSLIISDGDRPLAVAGIIGGDDSAVSEKTTQILLESAQFDPKIVRMMSKYLGIHTESSHRFERGVDPEMLDYALDRASSLIKELTNCKIIKGIFGPKIEEVKKVVGVRAERASEIIGSSFPEEEIISLLKRLNILFLSKTNDILNFKIPSYRNDIEAEIDLIEEIARLYGLNNIPSSKSLFSTSSTPEDFVLAFEDELKNLVLQEGLQEWITCNLLNPKIAELARQNPNEDLGLIHVLHPSSIDQSVLRTSLLPGFLQIIKLNENQKNLDLHAFEIGNVHSQSGKDNYKEHKVIGLILKGYRRPYHFDPKPEKYDFFDLKGIIQNLLTALKIPNNLNFGFLSSGSGEICDEFGQLSSKRIVESAILEEKDEQIRAKVSDSERIKPKVQVNIDFQASSFINLHPSRQAVIMAGNDLVGFLGEIHPNLLTGMEISDRVFFAELNVETLLKLKPKKIHFHRPSAFPISERDWTVTLDKKTPIKEVLGKIAKTRSKYLENVYLIDVYEGKNVAEGFKNVTFRFIYRDKEKTISFEDVEKEHNKILEKLKNN